MKWLYYGFHLYSSIHKTYANNIELKAPYPKVETCSLNGTSTNNSKDEIKLLFEVRDKSKYIKFTYFVKYCAKFKETKFHLLLLIVGRYVFYPFYEMQFFFSNIYFQSDD